MANYMEQWLYKTRSHLAQGGHHLAGRIAQGAVQVEVLLGGGLRGAKVVRLCMGRLAVAGQGEGQGHSYRELVILVLGLYYF